MLLPKGIVDVSPLHGRLWHDVAHGRMIGRRLSVGQKRSVLVGCDLRRREGAPGAVPAVEVQLEAGAGRTRVLWRVLPVANGKGDSHGDQEELHGTD